MIYKKIGTFFKKGAQKKGSKFMSIEQDIKKQYEIFFEKQDYIKFKMAADYYFENAAKILKKDITYSANSLKLLRRNTLKRLYIGIGCELLLKAIFLKNDYCINEKKSQPKFNGILPYKISDIHDRNNFKKDTTIKFNDLIQKLFHLNDYKDKRDLVERGLIIAKVFRNKEGHTIVYWHEFDIQNYRDIEKSLVEIYKTSFNENLELTFALSKEDIAKFNKTDI
jgi:hypothetical protein